MSISPFEARTGTNIGVQQDKHCPYNHIPSIQNEVDGTDMKWKISGLRPKVNTEANEASLVLRWSVFSVFFLLSYSPDGVYLDSLCSTVNELYRICEIRPEWEQAEIMFK
ncbi:hypothetical protein RvY_02231 [Ramazzottius varieornatus]|uniref:Uncharacterized protein n=1 Tax=Ramazzottius varieornatus TaxID=947166 RepID=A0A1D1UR20_RAMVA|nr:hypothetical protein RvY_02231 [Ramazzottius varieornatus]